MNKVIICGNLGANPEVRQTKSAGKVANLSIATNDRVKRSKVIVEGKLRTRKYQDKNNQERTSKEIIADRVHFVSKAQNLNDQSTSHPASTYDNIPF